MKEILENLGADENFVKQVLSNPLFFTKEVFDSNNKIIAASVVRLTSEISIFFDKDSNEISRSRALKYFLSKQIPEGKKLGIDQVLAFTSIDKNLMSHIGFKERDETPYILHF